MKEKGLGTDAELGSRLVGQDYAKVTFFEALLRCGVCFNSLGILENG